MDEDRIKGAIAKAKGAVKEGVGKALGNDRLVAEGHAQKAQGSAKEAAGKLRDQLKDVSAQKISGTHGAGDGPDD